MGFEPTDGTLGRYCLTTWRHPLDGADYRSQGRRCQGKEVTRSEWPVILGGLFGVSLRASERNEAISTDGPGDGHPSASLGAGGRPERSRAAG